MTEFDYDNYLSPCKDLCKLDYDKTYCTGCYRTVDEKKKWFQYSREEKLKIMSILPKREKKGFPFDKM